VYPARLLFWQAVQLLPYYFHSPKIDFPQTGLRINVQPVGTPLQFLSWAAGGLDWIGGGGRFWEVHGPWVYPPNSLFWQARQALSYWIQFPLVVLPQTGLILNGHRA
jgi:hypothetical protein